MKLKSAAVFALLLFAGSVSAQQKPAVPEIDRVRLAEAFRIGETLGRRVWKDWPDAPFAVLLITGEQEFLIRHPRPPEDFAPAGHDALLRSDVYFRKRTFDPALLATFPFGGVPTIVIGQAEKTAKKTSTPWVVTVLHEHFHQLQYSRPDYYRDVAALELARGDQTGMWMLNYAFPYADARVKERFESMSRLLAAALRAGSKRDFDARLAEYVAARRAFGAMLAPEDFRYFSFQVWQEGMSRYTEYRIAEAAARRHRPSKQFRALRDFRPFRETADEIKRKLVEELTTLRLDEYKRVAFYPLGAGEGLLLDRLDPRWQRRYFTERFYVDKYFEPLR
ncbi:MAG TPA: hypothetical protein VFX96_12035 [Pyrinomonadaceae bacterium]|nr:hypothetical protein [Pyrinomonadaceae bacterium]